MAKRASVTARPPPATKDWKATLDVRPPIRPGPEPLRVAGQVDVGSIGASAHLKEASQGTDPEVLLLTLTIRLDREGAPTRHVYKPAHFKKDSKKGQYKTVNILWEGEVIAHTPVVNVG